MFNHSTIEVECDSAGSSVRHNNTDNIKIPTHSSQKAQTNFLKTKKNWKWTLLIEFDIGDRHWFNLDVCLFFVCIVLVPFIFIFTRVPLPITYYLLLHFDCVCVQFSIVFYYPNKCIYGSYRVLLCWYDLCWSEKKSAFKYMQPHLSKDILCWGNAKKWNVQELKTKPIHSFNGETVQRVKKKVTFNKHQIFYIHIIIFFKYRESNAILLHYYWKEKEENEKKIVRNGLKCPNTLNNKNNNFSFIDIVLTALSICCCFLLLFLFCFFFLNSFALRCVCMHFINLCAVA